MKLRGKFEEFLVFLRPHRRRMIALAFLTLALSILAMLPPLITRAVVDRVITRGDRSILFGLSFVLLTLPVLSALCGYLQILGLTYVGQKFVFQVRQNLYEHLLRLDMRFFGKNSVGMLTNRLMGDSGAVQRLLTDQTVGVVSDFISSAFAITVTFAINWRLGLLLVLFISVFVINFRINISSIRQANRNYQRAMDRLSAGLQNRLTVNLAIKSHGSEDREHGVFRGQSGQSLDQIKDLSFANNTFWRNTELLAESGRAIIYFLGCALVLTDRMTYGDVLAFTSYAMQLLWPAVRFSMMAKQIQDVGVAADRLLEVMREEPEIRDRPAARAVGRLRGQVSFEHVTFAYEPGKPVIRNFDLRIEAGQSIALIGPTGCGKSTVLSLLLRFFDVQEGAVRIDGHDVRDLRVHSLRRQFGIVLQEPLLFTASIEENIRYARPSATRADVERAAQVAEILDFIQSLPKGYDT
ncbi:MAG: ABC transporter ATP-binding protein, partial [Kiritimatiellia bacterium]|nr:ABC transporter ATP-binding protein [Kiritimatiellia bacterium]